MHSEPEIAESPLAGGLVAAVAAERRRLATFARIAEHAVGSGSLQSTLDALAREVLGATAAVSCTVIVIERSSGEITAAGAAGDPRDHLTRVQEAMRLGAPLQTLLAARRKDPRVERDLRALVGRDPRFAPLAPIVEEGHWQSLVAVPLIVRGVVLGVLTTYYPSASDPADAEVEFLSAMAEQAAIAVSTARLFADAEASAALDERNRLARDLHDSIGQNLYSLVLQTRALQAAATRRSTVLVDDLDERLRTLRTLAEAALEDIRTAIMHLRSPMESDGSGLSAAISEHAAVVSERDGVQVTVHPPPHAPLLSLGAEYELLRIVMEAFANSIRHGRARHIEVGITEPEDRDQLVLSVSDDGCGFDAASRPHPSHVGLRSMRERAERLGGELEVSSSPRGTSIRVLVPYRRWPGTGMER